jgi:hypothetical protein
MASWTLCTVVGVDGVEKSVLPGEHDGGVTPAATTQVAAEDPIVLTAMMHAVKLRPSGSVTCLE